MVWQDCTAAERADLRNTRNYDADLANRKAFGIWCTCCNRWLVR